MSSRADEKRRREERERRERVAERLARTRRRIWLAAGIAVAAAAIVGILAIVSGDGGPQGLGGGEPLAGQAEVAELFAGVPQSGTVAGDPEAPVKLVEFVDMQCPFCGAFARDELPAIVRDYVRTGRVSLELQVLTFLGPDSERAGQMVAAASLQDRAWQFADLFFHNQGPENSGYATDEFLTDVAAGVEGLDGDRAIAQSTGPAAARVLARAQRTGDRLGVQSTPTFFAGPAGGRLEPLQLAEPTAAEIGRQLDRLLER